jgi:neuropeptide Y receptor
MCKLVLALEAIPIFVSTISITAIALDRYQVILHSGEENTLSSILKLVSIWITAIMLALPLFLFRTVETHKLSKDNSIIQMNIFSEMISLLIVFQIEISHRHAMA